MTALLILWLVATVALAVLLGVTVLVQRIRPACRPVASGTARPAPELEPQGEASRPAA